MSNGNEVCFELGRRQIDTLLQHGMEVDFEGFQIAGCSAVKISYRFIAEEDGEHAAETVNLYRYIGLSCCLFQTAGQNSAKAFCAVADIVQLHVGGYRLRCPPDTSGLQEKPSA